MKKVKSAPANLCLMTNNKKEAKQSATNMSSKAVKKHIPKHVAKPV